jgi:hypothetical protein
MTRQDVELLLKYLMKTPVLPNDQDQFIQAVERLAALLNKGKQRV